MKYILDFNKLYVNLVGFFSDIKNGTTNVVATAQMKFASEARLSPVFPLAIPLLGHFMGIEGLAVVHQTERYQLSLIL